MLPFETKSVDSDWANGDHQPTRITILVDNDVQPGLNLMAEHGFAALIERGPVPNALRHRTGPRAGA